MENEKINNELEELEEEADYIVLTMEDGSQKKFYLEDEFDYKGKKYFCISPAEEMEDITEGELLIYEVSDTEDEFMLNPIEDEAYLEEVYNEYCRRYDEEMDCDCDCEHEDCSCCGSGEHGCGCNC